MDIPQLPLFDWSTTAMSEGYRRLAAFRFDEAEQYFRDVCHAGQGEEEEMARALHACAYWQALLAQHKENPGACTADVLYGELRCYTFGNVSGLHQLKDALLTYIAELLYQAGIFILPTAATKPLPIC